MQSLQRMTQPWVLSGQGGPQLCRDLLWQAHNLTTPPSQSVQHSACYSVGATTLQLRSVCTLALHSSKLSTTARSGRQPWHRANLLLLHVRTIDALSSPTA